MTPMDDRAWECSMCDEYSAEVAVVEATLDRVRELADGWERSGRPRIGASEAAEELRAALGVIAGQHPQKQVACTACDQGYPASACSSNCDCGAC